MESAGDGRFILGKTTVLEGLAMFMLAVLPDRAGDIEICSVEEMDVVEIVRWPDARRSVKADVILRSIGSEILRSPASLAIAPTT